MQGPGLCPLGVPHDENGTELVIYPCPTNYMTFRRGIFTRMLNVQSERELSLIVSFSYYHAHLVSCCMYHMYCNTNFVECHKPKLNNS